MRRNIRIIFENLHDSATLDATSEATPVTYTQRSGRSYRYRTEGTSQQVITATLAKPTFLTAVVIYGHNLSSEGKVRIEYLRDDEVVLDGGEQFVSELIPLGQWRAGIDPWGGADLTEMPTVQHTLWTDSTLATGYRITLEDPGNPDGYLEVSRIFTGYSYSPEMNISYGVELNWEDFGENRRTESGSLYTVGNGTARVLSFDLQHLDRDEQIKLTRAMLRTDKARDVYINVYPEEGGLLESEHAFVARRESPYGHKHTRYNNWETSPTFWEI